MRRQHLPGWPRTVLMMLLCSVLVGPTTDTFGQTSTDRSRFVAWSYDDAGAWVTSWDSRRALRAAGLAATIAPFSLLDEQVGRRAADYDTGPFGVFLDGANELGGPYGALLPAGLFAVSLATDDRKFQDVAFTSLQSVVYANAITFSLKYFLGRSRPNADRGAFDFNPFSGATSFPSGHTTTAFAIVSPWAFYYPNIATYSLFVVATGTAVARMAKRKHWLTDVLAGAAIGIAMSHWLYERHEDRYDGGEQLAPAAAVLTSAMAFRVRF